MFYNSARTNPPLPPEIHELARTPFSNTMDLIGGLLKLFGIFLIFAVCLGAGLIFAFYYIK